MSLLDSLRKIKLPKSFGATYQREIAGKAENKVRFYATLAFLTVVLFLIFGIRPLSLTTAQNRKVERELTEIKISLEEKIDKINESIDQIQTLEEKVLYLYGAIPTDVMLEDYLEEFVLSSAKSGFVVQRFRQQDTPGEAIHLEIELTGNLSELPNLISATENLFRYTEITHIRTDFEEGFTNVRLGVKIYKL